MLAKAGVQAADRGPVASLLSHWLDKMMMVERVYRQEGLTVGRLAAKLDLPEYRLRQAINEGLGYRSFNAFFIVIGSMRPRRRCPIQVNGRC